MCCTAHSKVNSGKVFERYKTLDVSAKHTHTHTNKKKKGPNWSPELCLLGNPGKTQFGTGLEPYDAEYLDITAS